MKANSISRFLILGSAVAAMGLGGVSCNKVLDEQSIAPENLTVQTKVMQLADQYTKDMLLVKTNTSDPSESDLLSRLDGVKKVENLLKSTKGKEELEARFGLDRWYAVTLS